MLPTALYGIAEPGVAGDVKVAQITPTSFALRSQPGHPAYPGVVAFSFSVEANGFAYLTVRGSSSAPVPGGNEWAYDHFSTFYWSGFAERIDNNIIGGSW